MALTLAQLRIASETLSEVMADEVDYLGVIESIRGSRVLINWQIGDGSGTEIAPRWYNRSELTLTKVGREVVSRYLTAAQKREADALNG